MSLPFWTADQAATIQAITAIVGIAIAIGVPYFQQRSIQQKAAKDKSGEIAAIRLAFHTEVLMVAAQCRHEFTSWHDAPPPPSQKNLRTAKFPPLLIYEGNVSKIGLLTRPEIVSLIAFHGTLHDISRVVNDMEGTDITNDVKTAPNQGPENRKTLMLLLSNACQKAADFLGAVPDIPEARNSSTFVSELRSIEKAMEGARTRNPVRIA
jgi:type II secretory pathway pseudopilin PulG